MINIREAAKLAGVSPATVSRVINGMAKVSAEKRARVLEAISATDFVPNEVASIICDYYGGGRMAVEHLIECGCRKIVCIKGPERVLSARDRFQGMSVMENMLQAHADIKAGFAANAG